MSELGQFALRLGLFLSGYAILADLLGRWRNRDELLVSARNATIGCLLCLTVAAAALWALLVRGDFAVSYVAEHTARALPLVYKLTAFWAGASGSLLLWLWLQTAFIVFAFSRCSGGLERFCAGARAAANFVAVFFFLVLIFDKDPFGASVTTPADGAGLNPLLQHPAMVLHPPALFLGYAAFAVPYAWAFSTLKREDSSGAPVLFDRARNWSLFAWVFLTIGIGLGAWWAYEELGWGGYWAWDPVENASLLPWLVAVAALHAIAGMSAKGGTDKFKLWSIVLAPVPFILCLVATFVTRSGFLSSVHSFGQSPMSLALSVFIGCCFLLWLACIVRACRCPATRSWRVPSRKSAFHLDKAEILSCAVVTLVLAAVIIGVATFWPVIWRIIKGSEAGFVPTSAFYNDVISVAGIVWAFLVGLAGLSDLPRARRGLTIKVLGCCAMGLLCSGSVYRLGGHRLLISLACGICAFSFVAIFLKLLHRLKIRARVAGEIAHLGLLVLVVAIGFSWGERSVQTLVTKGGKVVLGDYEFIYDSFAHKMSDGVTQAGPVIVVKNKDLQKRLWPHTNLYPGNRGREQSASEVAVHTRLSEDIYVSFDGVGQGGGVIITAKIKPFMLWLWLAAVLVIAGAAMAMSGRRARRSGQTVQILGPEPED